jgi:hypothetical protein
MCQMDKISGDTPKPPAGERPCTPYSSEEGYIRCVH